MVINSNDINMKLSLWVRLALTFSFSLSTNHQYNALTTEEHNHWCINPNKIQLTHNIFSFSYFLFHVSSFLVDCCVIHGDHAIVA